MCDNVSATYICQNPVFQSRMKHVAIETHLIREQVQNKELVVKYSNAADQVPDILTKQLPRTSFERNFYKLGVFNVTTNLQGHKRGKL